MTAPSRPIRLFAMDVDGTLSDGTLTLSADGGEQKTFHAHDGAAIQVLRRIGITPAIISGRRSAVTARRAGELGIEEVHQGVADKAACLLELCGRLGLDAGEAAFVGDDLSDVGAMRAAGYAAAPADATPEAREAADFVAPRGGGRGAVRDAIEHLLRAQGDWDPVLAALGPRRERA